MADGYLLEVAFTAPPNMNFAHLAAELDPVGLWLFADLTDSSGNGGTLTENGGTIPTAASLVPTDSTLVSRDLDGSGMYYTALDSTPLDVGDVFSFVGWVNLDSVTNQQLFSKGTGAPGVFLDAGGNFTLSKAGTGNIVQGGTLSSATTYMLAVTKNGGSSAKAYVNGVDTSGAVTNQTCTNTSTDLNIGRNSGGTNLLNGRICGFAVFNYALTQAQITALFQAGNPTWTDITSYMTEYATRHGKQKQLGTPDAGTLTLRLENHDRRFDPSHPSSPYYPNVLPLRQIRLLVEKATVVTPLFRGFVQSWPQEWKPPRAGWTTLDCVDGFLPLSHADVGEGETWPAELSGARINRILDGAGWPASLRDIDGGESLIAEMTIQLGSGITALAAILEAADAELGSFFIDGQGRACFHDRHRRRQAAYLTAAATFQDGASGGSYIYKSISFDTDDDSIANDIQVTATGGETARAQDATSQTMYWRRTIARSIPLARDTEAQDQAEWLLLQNKDPRAKITGIELKPLRRESGMWAAVVGREISDHVLVNRWPQQVGSVISQHCSIESIQVHGKPGGTIIGDVTVNWTLSTPAPSAVDWWILGDSTYGVLGSTTKVIY